LSAEDRTCRSGTDDENVNFSRKLGRACDRLRCGGTEVGISRPVSVSVELHRLL
jgi:hypothetical protein